MAWLRPLDLCVVLVSAMAELCNLPGLWLGVAFLLWCAVLCLGICLRRDNGYAMPVLSALASLVLLLSAATGPDATFTLPAPLGLGETGFSLALDPLARWFLGIFGLVGLPVALFTQGYLRHLQQRQTSPGYIWAALALLHASMAGVILSANAMVFLVAWELMAFSSFLLVASDHERRSIRQAALLYLGATRAGTAFLMAGFLWAYQLSGSWSFADWHIMGSATLAPALLILAGLATKAGCWPFHLWLPIAHPAAPAPVSAIMSGLMIKTAIYAMARLYIVGGHFDTPALGPILLVLGAISAFWGVIFALLQHDLKRLLGYHSVENIGIIMLGLGLSLVGTRLGLPWLAQLSLAAALFHTLNHAVFKSLLFLGAGAVDVRTHLRDVERLGGLIRKMPWTAAAFVLGSAAICALPPLNGFASEWLLYQGFFTLAQAGTSPGLRLAGLLLMAWLAMVGALALACFVKAVGIVFLGNPRSPQASEAREVEPAMRAAQVILAALCVVLGLAAGPVLALLSRIPAAGGAIAQLSEAWTLPLLALTIGTGAVFALIAGWAWWHARRHPARRFITWECGFGDLDARMQYTATSFAQPVSRLFGALYRYETTITTVGPRGLFAQGVEARARHEAYLETRVYQPLLRWVQRLSGALLLRLQAGGIQQYLLHMALVLALLLWMVARS